MRNISYAEGYKQLLHLPDNLLFLPGFVQLCTKFFKGFIITISLIFFCAESSKTLPICDFFAQNEIVSSYSSSTPSSLKNIYFINIEKGYRPYNTIVFDDSCKILYKRELGDISLAIFSLDDTSNVIFITKGRGSAYAVDAYLVSESDVIPVIIDLASKSYPLFDNLQLQVPPDIISCTNTCSTYRFYRKKKRYIKTDFKIKQPK